MEKIVTSDLRKKVAIKLYDGIKKSTKWTKYTVNIPGYICVDIYNLGVCNAYRVQHKNRGKVFSSKELNPIYIEKFLKEITKK